MVTLYVNIQAILNQAGLTRSAHILADALRSADCHVTINARHPSITARSFHQIVKLCRPFPFDVNISLEHVDPGTLTLAPINLLVPNQEWLREDTVPDLKVIDGALCKTLHAQAIFRERTARAVFTSFTSVDCLSPHTRMDYGLFFHLAGSSQQKGTDALVVVWRRHPEWPTLTIVQHPDRRCDVRAPNIHYIPEHLSDDQLKALQNAHGVHLCPSEAEGFGHSMVEAMSCRAVVVTTDGPPMNEIIESNRGLLVPYSHCAPQRLGTSYFVDVDALEHAVSLAIAMDDKDKRAIGQRARLWFETNDACFRRTISDVVRRWQR
jgi:glycosyltransferase involved in cell wall biosynthesis